MWNSIKRETRLCICDFWIYALIELIAFILGAVIMTGITAFKIDSYFPMGASLALIICILTTLFGNIACFSLRFDGAVTLGATRKKHLPAVYIVYFCITVLLFMELKFLHMAENLFYKAVFPDVTGEILFKNNFAFYWIMAISLFVLGISSLVSATMRKFGKTAQFLWLILWIAACLTLPDVITGEGKNIVQITAVQVLREVTRLGTPIQVIALSVTGIVFTGIAYGIMRKQAAA